MRLTEKPYEGEPWSVADVELLKGDRSCRLVIRTEQAGCRHTYPFEADTVEGAIRAALQYFTSIPPEGRQVAEADARVRPVPRRA